jgi:hypothetical protein
MSRTIREHSKRETFAFTILGLAAIAVAAMFFISPPGSAAGKPKISAPILSCAGSGQTYIDVGVTGGSPTGAPAGFTIQWQTTGDYQQFGWPADSSCPPDAEGVPTCGESFCKASFSGNSASTNYNLAAGQSVTVRIGDLATSNGVSSSCPGGTLLCGHNYVFRAFAHANSTNQRSDFTENLTCATTDCPAECDSQVHGLNFWSTHQEIWPGSILEAGLTIGCTPYTASELEGILLATPVEGDCNTALLQQVIIANLNIANGASEEYFALTLEPLTGADALLCPGGEGDCASLLATLDFLRAQDECPTGE